MEKKYLKSSFLHGFVGIGAIFGGMLAITNPSGDMFGMPAVESLKNSPFSSFLIPGLFLFIVIGLGNLSMLLFLKFNKDFYTYISGIFGIILCMWIVIQCIMLLTIHILHIIFFSIGVLQIMFGMLILRKSY